MVTDTYDPREQRLFVDGLARSRTSRARRNGGGFMARRPRSASPLLERLDREALEYMRRPGAEGRPHYFRLIKETDAARLLHVRDRLHAGAALRRGARPFEPTVTYTAGDKAWAGHA
jgi:hypothetical protein